MLVMSVSVDSYLLRKGWYCKLTGTEIRMSLEAGQEAADTLSVKEYVAYQCMVKDYEKQTVCRH